MMIMMTSDDNADDDYDDGCHNDISHRVRT